MFRFTLFGIPVEVQPFFWLSMAFFGGITAGVDSAAEIFAIILFILAAFISILVHEFGHALTGRRFGGGSASIVLHAFGGLAYTHGGRFTRLHNFYRIAAGPGAGFAFLWAIIAVLCLAFNSLDVMNFTGMVLFEMNPSFRSERLITLLSEKPFIRIFLTHLIWINFWWGILNLLPVLPLDGGRIMELYVRPQKRVYQIGLITGVAMAVLGFLWMGSTYTGILFGFLAWQNYQSMQETGWR
jgi:stage IV sporulation protein FB